MFSFVASMQFRFYSGPKATSPALAVLLWAIIFFFLISCCYKRCSQSFVACVCIWYPDNIKVTCWNNSGNAKTLWHYAAAIFLLIPSSYIVFLFPLPMCSFILSGPQSWFPRARFPRSRVYGGRQWSNDCACSLFTSTILNYAANWRSTAQCSRSREKSSTIVFEQVVGGV